MDRTDLNTLSTLIAAHASCVNAIAALESDIGDARAEAEVLEAKLLSNNLLVAAVVASDASLALEREKWMHTRNERWFEDTLPGLGEATFRENFRVSSRTFRFIVDVCRQDMEKEVTNMRQPISVEKRVAMALYRLCSSAEDRTVANLFGVGRSTLNETYREFCAVVIDRLENQFLKMITSSEMETHIRDFKAVCGFPQAVGAVDGCHLPVSPPKEHATDYYNYKGWYSVVLLALVDHKYQFRYINIGSPGRCHDAYIFARSSLSALTQSALFERPTAVITGTVVPPLILCDQAFPLSRSTMKPFPHNAPLTPAQSTFNYQLSQSRIIVENAFGRMKARFRYVLKRMECDIVNVNDIIRACCVLHNMCEHFSHQ